MKTGFYSKIAAENMKKNPRLYVPRILSEAGLIGSFYIMAALAMDRRMSEAPGGDYLPTFMGMGTVVIGFLSLIIILYVNSFLMKQRKKEYGLYNVLGMEKKHVIRILFTESFFAFVCSAFLGILFGLLFYKLSSLLICRLLQTEAIAGFYYINTASILFPLAAFAVFDLFAFVIGSLSIRRLKTVELLSAGHTGEKEPRIKWLLLIIGLLTIGAGYYISITTKAPLRALYLFFAAVILVIIGTYCLFITGTTFVLKCLKKNQSYYYHKRHMPAVAGLLFRMKQNAVGLASIAILSTGVLVMVSTTVSLYSGTQETLDKNYPRQLYLSAGYEEDGQVIDMPASELEEIVSTAAKDNGLEIRDTKAERYLTVSYLLRDGSLLMKNEVEGSYRIEEIVSVTFIIESTYREMTGYEAEALAAGDLNLAENEFAYCRISGDMDFLLEAPVSLKLNGEDYRIKRELAHFPVKSDMENITNCIGIVCSDEAVLQKIYLAEKEGFGENASEFSDRISVNFTDEEAAAAKGKALKSSILEALRRQMPEEGGGYSLNTKWDAKESLLGMYGTFLFLGVLLGFVCLFSTILIIYYKQISEGYEDRSRFQIMQKIGMEQKEVRRIINYQLILQFFLPLVTAGIHTAAAFPILLRLLKILMLTNTGLFVLCTIISYAVFAAVYIAVYLLTSRTYYKIVR